MGSRLNQFKPFARRSTLTVIVGCLLVPGVMSGCETVRITTGVSRQVPAQPRQAPTTPEDALVNRMVFVVGSKPHDTDGNGFPDRIETTVTLFATPYPSPKWSAGRIVCGMYRKGTARRDQSEPVAEWIFENDALERARTMSRVGRQYRLPLNLLEVGTDRLPFSEVDLICRFEPAGGGEPVHCDGVRSIQIGRRPSR